ncbi:MAG: hypothetical protein COA79_23165 [Planctomycetota bacterium]|nr:MAG: hypothetical protein COA79_23165 [Planctomycetota bacterium]
MNLNNISWHIQHVMPFEKQLTEEELKLNTSRWDTISQEEGEKLGLHLFECKEEGWYQTTLPADVHDIMINAGEIEDPFYGRNSLKSEWVAEREWWFRGKFILTDEEKKDLNKSQLIFHGLDLHATIWLNGNKLGESHDMFSPAIFDTLNGLLEGKNVIAVKISPHVKTHVGSYRSANLIKDCSYELKSQCSYGWDWMRAMNSLGIWKDVELKSIPDATIKHVHVQTSLNDDLSKAKIIIDTSFKQEKTSNLQLKISLTDPIGKTVSENISTINNTISSNEISIDTPALWWPKNYGDQNLYQLKVELMNNGILFDEKNIIIGLRKLEKIMVKNGDPDKYHPHQFVINNEKIFIMGANWVPLDAFPARLTRSRYEAAIKIASDNNLNMLRIWGGGLSESDDFFELCNVHGLMIWFDFPLACAKYPEDPKWLEAYTNQIKNTIDRVHHHCSIVQWCGGNEVFAYNTKFDHPALVMPEKELKKVLPNAYYFQACPDEKEGDHHGPWNITPRWDPSEKIDHNFWNNEKRMICTESGCDGMASMKELHNFIPEKDLFILSETLKYHFASDTTSHSLSHFNLENLDDYIVASQWMASDMIRNIVASHRRRIEECAGIMIWMFNEPWPSCSWAMIGYGEVVRPQAKAFAEAAASETISVEDQGIMITDKIQASIWYHQINTSDMNFKITYSLTTDNKTLLSDTIEILDIKTKSIKLKDLEINTKGIDTIIQLQIELNEKKITYLYGNEIAWKSKEAISLCSNFWGIEN